MEPKAESVVWCVLETSPPPSPLPPQKDSGGSRTPPREAQSTGTRRHVLEALLLPPREGSCECRCGPQWAPQNTPRAGMLAAHEGAPPVLRDTAPGLPKHGPPWDIEGELGGTRPFEAENESDADGHFGRTKTTSVASASQIRNNHVPWARTHHHHHAIKLAYRLRFETHREGAWLAKLEEKKVATRPLRTPTHHAPVTRVTWTRAPSRLARWLHPKPCTSNKALFPLVACKMHFASVSRLCAK